MWWRNLSALVVMSALGLSGCGFHPLYAQRQASTAQAKDVLGTVHISTINDRSGQILRNNLLERFTPNGEPSAPRYTLTVTLLESMAGINFQKNATASGGELTMSVTWALINNQTGLSVSQGAFSSVDSVNYLGPRYASVAAESDAESRLLSDIADLMTEQVAVYLSSPARLKVQADRAKKP